MTTIEQRSATSADYQTTIRIKASPDAIFDALTTVTGLAAWWNPATGSGESGGELRFVMNAPEPLVIYVDEATRPTSVRWTVTDCPFLPDWIGTRPTFTITPVDGNVSELHFHHQGLSQELECIDMCTRSWNHYMTSLRDSLEVGHGSPYGSPADRARRDAQARPRQVVETSIHQETLIAALPQQVFDLLTSGNLFSAATG
ncbi:MAG: SRPBCC family protein, partial [Chloroflexota bacterium]